MFLNNLTLRVKLMAGFIALAVIVLLISALALTSLSQSNHRFEAFTTGVGQKEAVAADLQGAAARRAIAVRDMLLVTDPAQVRAFGARNGAQDAGAAQGAGGRDT